MSGTYTRTTTQRGYGTQHQATRKALLPMWVGRRCPCECGCVTVMTDPEQMDLDHEVPLAVDGQSRARRMVCAPCNRGHRAREAKLAKRGDPTPPRRQLGATTMGW